MRNAASGLVAGIVACSGIGLGTQAAAAGGYGSQGERLVTPPVFDTSHAHSITANPYQGRLWYGRDIIGGQEPTLPLLREGPGPGAYGAPEWDDTRFLASYGSSVVELSPWSRYPTTGVLDRLEDRRGQYLAERGYTGGVRTFVNPLYRDTYLESRHGRRHAPSAEYAGHPLADALAAQRDARGEIKPSATIRLSPEMPRFESKIQVRNGPSRAVPGTLDIVVLDIKGDRVAYTN